MDLFSNLAAILSPQPIKFNELAAIWVQDAVHTDSGKHYRLCEGLRVCIRSGKLIHEYAAPTHQITSVWGTNIDKFELHLMDLKTQELSVVKI